MAYADFEDELLAIVAAASGTSRGAAPAPGVPLVPKTLLTSVEEARRSITEYLKRAQEGQGAAPPYVVVLVGELVHDPTWGVRSRTYRAPVTLGVIDLPARGADQRSAHALATAVADAIDDGDPFDTFQSPPERATVDSSSANSVFAALTLESKVEAVASTVRWEPGLLIYRN